MFSDAHNEIMKKRQQQNSHAQKEIKRDKIEFMRKEKPDLQDKRRLKREREARANAALAHIIDEFMALRDKGLTFSVPTALRFDAREYFLEYYLKTQTIIYAILAVLSVVFAWTSLTYTIMVAVATTATYYSYTPSQYLKFCPMFKSVGEDIKRRTEYYIFGRKNEILGVNEAWFFSFIMVLLYVVFKSLEFYTDIWPAILHKKKDMLFNLSLQDSSMAIVTASVPVYFLVKNMSTYLFGFDSDFYSFSKTASMEVDNADEKDFIDAEVVEKTEKRGTGW